MDMLKVKEWGSGLLIDVIQIKNCFVDGEWTNMGMDFGGGMLSMGRNKSIRGKKNLPSTTLSATNSTRNGLWRQRVEEKDKGNNDQQ
jgi:hypothetical protein